MPFGPFYADLLCFSEKLAIEVDGDTHATTAGHDASRSAFMRREGYTVIRFGNPDVMQNLDGVLTQIAFSLREKEGARRVSGGKDEGDHPQEKGASA